MDQPSHAAAAASTQASGDEPSKVMQETAAEMSQPPHAAAADSEAAQLMSSAQATAAASRQASGETIKVGQEAAAEKIQPPHAATADVSCTSNSSCQQTSIRTDWQEAAAKQSQPPHVAAAAASAGPKAPQLTSAPTSAAASRHASEDKASKLLQEAWAAGQAILTGAGTGAVPDAKNSSKAFDIAKALTASESGLNAAIFVKESVMIAIARADRVGQQAAQPTGCIPYGTSLGLRLSDKQIAQHQRESLVHQDSDHERFVQLCARRNSVLKQVSHLTECWIDLEEQIQHCLSCMGTAPASRAAVTPTAADWKGATLSLLQL